MSHKQSVGHHPLGHHEPEHLADGAEDFADLADGAEDLGQATAEYALVLLGAATIALILIGWATGGGNRIAGLLDHVLDTVTGHVK